MPTNLSIKNVPEDIAERLKKRAALHHRSLQGELMSIIEAAADEPHPERRYLTPSELVKKIRALGIHSPSTSVDIIRAARDQGE